MYYSFQAIRAAIIMQICWCSIIKVFVHCSWTYTGGLVVLVPLTADLNDDYAGIYSLML